MTVSFPKPVLLTRFSRLKIDQEGDQKMASDPLVDGRTVQSMCIIANVR